MGTFHNDFIRVSHTPKQIMMQPEVFGANPNKLWSFLDKDGKEVTENRFEDIGDFNEALALAALTNNGLVGFINTKGEFVTEQIYQSYEGTAFKYEAASAFFWGGIATAKLNGKWGVSIERMK